MRLLVVDTETTGLIGETPESELIEVAAATYCTETRTVLSTIQYLIPCLRGNKAEHINHISNEALKQKPIKNLPHAFFSMYHDCTYVVAHNAKFDKYFIKNEYKHLPEKQWICTYEDIQFPDTKRSLVLSHIAVDHGIMPFDMHRALGDVNTLVNLLMKVPNLEEQINRVVEVKTRGGYFVTTDAQNARDAGFRWNFDTKKWGKWLLPEEVSLLQFHVERKFIS